MTVGTETWRGVAKVINDHLDAVDVVYRDIESRRIARYEIRQLAYGAAGALRAEVSFDRAEFLRLAGVE